MVDFTANNDLLEVDLCKKMSVVCGCVAVYEGVSTFFYNSVCSLTSISSSLLSMEKITCLPDSRLYMQLINCQCLIPLWQCIGRAVL